MARLSWWYTCSAPGVNIKHILDIKSEDPAPIHTSQTVDCLTARVSAHRNQQSNNVKPRPKKPHYF